MKVKGRLWQRAALGACPTMKHRHKTHTAGYNPRILSSNTSSILLKFASILSQLRGSSAQCTLSDKLPGWVTFRNLNSYHLPLILFRTALIIKYIFLNPLSYRLGFLSINFRSLKLPNLSLFFLIKLSNILKSCPFMILG